MKKAAKITLLVLVILLVIIQFYPSELPVREFDNISDLIVSENVPYETAGLLRNSCYDCHSNETNYPWYSYIAPVKWIIGRDVRKGREEMNFSEWATLETREKIKLLEEITDEVEKNEMPLPIYTVMHGDAELSDSEKEMLFNWVEEKITAYFGE